MEQKLLFLILFGQAFRSNILLQFSTLNWYLMSNVTLVTSHLFSHWSIFYFGKVFRKNLYLGLVKCFTHSLIAISITNAKKTEILILTEDDGTITTQCRPLLLPLCPTNTSLLSISQVLWKWKPRFHCHGAFYTSTMRCPMSIWFVLIVPQFAISVFLSYYWIFHAAYFIRSAKRKWMN